MYLKYISVNSAAHMLCCQGLETSSEASAFGCPVWLVLNPLNWSNGKGISQVFLVKFGTHTYRYSIYIYIYIFVCNIVHVGLISEFLWHYVSIMYLYIVETLPHV